MEKKKEEIFTTEQCIEILRENYDRILDVFNHYMDMDEDDKAIIATWIIGTYYYKEFISFPYLFINAIRSAGKTRLENIIKHLAWNGEMLASLREATIFRTAGKKTLIIDEFEQIGDKEALNLQELLNASYKRGMKVFRMRKVKKLDGETQEVEEFEPYCPIIMANINGMGDTLLSRCIQIILERSDNPMYSLKIEDFDINPVFLQVKNTFKAISNRNFSDLVYKCSYFGIQGLYMAWNNWINEKYTTYITPYTYITQNTQTTPTTEETLRMIEREALFVKIHDSGIRGRNFELFLPLFLISYVLGYDKLDKMIEIAKKKVLQERIEESFENNDVLLMEFVSTQESNYTPVNQLTEHFKLFIGEKGYEKSDINKQWIGRALKRLNLVLEKRRVSEGIEVRLNIGKAKEKIRQFK